MPNWFMPPTAEVVAFPQHRRAATLMRRLQWRLAELGEAPDDFDKARLRGSIEDLFREALNAPGAVG